MFQTPFFLSPMIPIGGYHMEKKRKMKIMPMFLMNLVDIITIVINVKVNSTNIKQFVPKLSHVMKYDKI